MEKSILDFPEATIEDINNIITSLNSNKAICPDYIPLKKIKNVTDSHLACVINKNVQENKFSENGKTALVRPILKKDDWDKIKNYRPVNLFK